MKKPLSYNLTVENHKALKEVGKSVGSASFWLDRHLKEHFSKGAPVTKELLAVKPKTKRFKPPTICEVSAYCEERQNNVNPESFINHYESNGWMRGKAKVKDWKACVRTWEQNSSNKKSELDFSDDKTGWSNQDYGLIR